MPAVPDPSRAAAAAAALAAAAKAEKAAKEVRSHVDRKRETPHTFFSLLRWIVSHVAPCCDDLHGRDTKHVKEGRGGEEGAQEKYGSRNRGI